MSITKEIKIMAKLSRDKLINLIKEVMLNAKRTIVCEAQLQFDLAWKLKKFYEETDTVNVFLEYAVKDGKQKAEDEKKNSRYSYYDIVIKEGDEFIPIELKSKTKSVKDRDEYSNQSAQDLARYDFWRDVERIENFSTWSKQPANIGYAVMVTNDGAYVKNSGENAMYKNFAMNRNRAVKAGVLDWIWKTGKRTETVGNNRVDGLTISNDYELNWEEEVPAKNDVKFNVLVLEVKIRGSE